MLIMSVLSFQKGVLSSYKISNYAGLSKINLCNFEAYNMQLCVS